jgi:thiol:disulfide interchange protein
MLRTAVKSVSVAAALLILIAGALAACVSAPGTPVQPSRQSVAPAVAAVPVSAAPAPAPAPGSPPEPSADEYTTPLLEAVALAEAIQTACQTALSERRPILLEFSAPWCADCIALERLKRTPELASELQRWQVLPINIGNGDEHAELMRAFHVTAIAKLVVLRPSNCAAPIGSWPRGGTLTLDGLSKRVHDGERDLAGWLASARVGLRDP